MAEVQKRRFGGLGGYSIYRVEKTSNQGKVSVSYEVLTPENEYLDRFRSIEQAMRMVKSLAGVPLDSEDDF